MSEINRIYYNKLIRDNIPAKIEAKRQQCEVRKITDVQELQQELFKKIQDDLIVREDLEYVNSCRGENDKDSNRE